MELMTNIHPFQALINSAFPTLNAPVRHTRLADELRAELAALPALEEDDDEDEYTPCDSCGAPSTHAVYNCGDSSVGYGDSWIEMCDECDPTN
jgi:hypothetical protein